MDASMYVFIYMLYECLYLGMYIGNKWVCMYMHVSICECILYIYVYITYIYTYTCVFMYAYVNMYIDFHGHILSVCMDINTHI